MGEDMSGMISRDSIELKLDCSLEDDVKSFHLDDDSFLPNESDLIALIKTNILNDKIREQEQIKELKEEIDFLKSEITHKNKVITCLLTHMDNNRTPPNNNKRNKKVFKNSTPQHDSDSYEVCYESVSNKKGNAALLHHHHGDSNTKQTCKHSNQHVLNKIISKGGGEANDGQFADLKIYQDVNDPKPASWFSRRNFYQSLLQVDL